MRTARRFLGLWALLTAAAAAQATAPALANVFAAIDRVAPTITSLTADVTNDVYVSLANDHTVSRGTLAFKLVNGQPLYALDLTQPADAAVRLVYRNRTGYVYRPSAHQVVEHALGDKKDLLNFLLLGLASTAAQMRQDFDIQLEGTETIAGAPTVRLTLIPKEAALRGTYPQVDLWYDTRTWVAVQWQLFSGGGDYRRLTAGNVRINPKLGDGPFSTHFAGATVVKQ